MDSLIAEPEVLIGAGAQLAAVASALRSDVAVGAIVLGNSGSGKTSVVEAALAQLSESRAVIRAIAGPVSAETPYGALRAFLAEALPADAEVQALSVQPAALKLLRSKHAEAGRTAPLIVCDNAHHLDAASASLLAQLAARREVSLLLAGERFTPALRPLTALWSSGELVRVRLLGLDIEGTRALLENSLGRPVAADSVSEVFSRSGGSPRLVHAALEGQRGATAGREPDPGGAVHFERVDFSSLGAPYADRLTAGMDEAEVRAVRVLALAGSLPLSLLVDMTSQRAVDALFERRTVAQRRSAALFDAVDDCVTLCDPALAQSVAAGLSGLQRRSLWSALTGFANLEDLPSEVLLDCWPWALGVGAVFDVPERRRCMRAANARGRWTTVIDLFTAFDAVGPEALVELAWAYAALGGADEGPPGC